MVGSFFSSVGLIKILLRRCETQQRIVVVDLSLEHEAEFQSIQKYHFAAFHDVVWASHRWHKGVSECNHRGFCKDV